MTIVIFRCPHSADLDAVQLDPTAAILRPALSDLLALPTSPADIDAVELDPAVVAAATQAMGLPTHLPSLRLHCADAAAFLREQQAGGQRQQQQQQPYDLVFMDAFDGEDNVPAALCTPGVCCGGSGWAAACLEQCSCTQHVWCGEHALLASPPVQCCVP